MSSPDLCVTIILDVAVANFYRLFLPCKALNKPGSWFRTLNSLLHSSCASQHAQVRKSFFYKAILYINLEGMCELMARISVRNATVL